MKKHVRHTNIILTADFLPSTICVTTPLATLLLARRSCSNTTRNAGIFSALFSSPQAILTFIFITIREKKETEQQAVLFSLLTKPTRSVSDRKLLHKPNAFPA